MIYVPARKNMWKCSNRKMKKSRSNVILKRLQRTVKKKLLIAKIQEKYRAFQELHLQFLINMHIVKKFKTRMTIFLDVQNFENGEHLLVVMIEKCKLIEICVKLLKEGFEKMMKIRAFTTDIKKLKETFLDWNKSHMKIIEEVSPEISEILVKLVKPSSLLELGLERVQALGFSQQEEAMEQLPVALKVQVSEG